MTRWLLALVVLMLAALPLRAQDVGLGLAAVHDWSSQAPFIDVMKTARPWIGHLPGRWGGVEESALRAQGHLDAEGWPLRIPPELGAIGTIVLSDMPVAASGLAGRYVLRFDGTGIVEVRGRVSNVRYGSNSVSFDYAPGPGEVDIRIQRSRESDPVRHITLVHEKNLAAFETGAVFNPDFLALLDGFAVLRFMDWMQTNNSTQSAWQDRPLPQDYTYARTGVPAEVMIDLANTTGIAPWFNMPHRADDRYVRQFAELVLARLDPTLKVHVEHSNEVWNWQFEQARWADMQARARWNAQNAWLQYYGMRAAEVARIWSDVFGAAAGTRLVNVIATQTGWPGLEETMLAAPLAMAEVPPPPAPPVAAFDAYAVTGYFGGILGVEAQVPTTLGWIAASRQTAEAQGLAAGLSGADLEAHVAAHRFDDATRRAAAFLADGAPSDTVAALLSDTLPYHAQVARRHGLTLAMYEGGTHVVGIGAPVDNAELTEFFIHFNYSPEMGALYERLLDGWATLSDAPFMAYSDVYAPNKWGSWGALRHLQDSTPRWDALLRHREGTR